MRDIIDLKSNSEIIIKISDEDYYKLNKTIYILKEKYDDLLYELHKVEQQDIDIFDFEKFKNEILEESEVVENIIKDVLKIYTKELETLECVFLSGSYARGTNKLSSDLDLHFFYKKGNFNYKYEEIVCYIISRIINKSRDCIDPTFILNLSTNYKNYVTSKMSNTKMNIVLKSEHGLTKYAYKEEKKRRFFLQYNNSRKIECLKQYIINEIKKNNPEWAHCFKVIYGNECFDKVYKYICIEERKQINLENLLSRMQRLETSLINLNTSVKDNDIATIKRIYQSFIFEQVYEYISIVRIMLIHKNKKVLYINLFELYDIVQDINYSISEVIQKIYKYMWVLRKLTMYCYENNINYGLHNHKIINYNICELNMEWQNLKIILIKSLNEMRNML